MEYCWAWCQRCCGGNDVKQRVVHPLLRFSCFAGQFRGFRTETPSRCELHSTAVWEMFPQRWRASALNPFLKEAQAGDNPTGGGLGWLLIGSPRDQPESHEMKFWCPCFFVTRLRQQWYQEREEGVVRLQEFEDFGGEVDRPFF